MDGTAGPHSFNPAAAAAQAQGDITQLSDADVAAQARIAELETQLAAVQADPGGQAQAAAAQPTVPTPAPAGPVPSVPQPIDGSAPVADEEPKAAPVIDLVKDALAVVEEHGPHGFIEALRSVSSKLVEEGRIVEADLLSGSEARAVNATVVKLLGDLVAKA